MNCFYLLIAFCWNWDVRNQKFIHQITLGLWFRMQQMGKSSRSPRFLLDCLVGGISNYDYYFPVAMDNDFSFKKRKEIFCFLKKLFLCTARPRGTLSTWPKKYSVPRNDLSWGTMYVLPCQTITKSVYLGVSTLY